jgi:DNA-directed RNA polymerase subunit RPC12/RpoP
MKTYKDFCCDNCGIIFQREARQCHKKREHNFCSKKCTAEFFTKSKEVACTNCGVLFIKTNAELKKHPISFCSHSCAAFFNNQKRITEGYSTKDKTKTIVCIGCGKDFIGSIHTVLAKSFCPDCSSKNFLERITKYNFSLALLKDKEINSSIDLLSDKRFCQMCQTEIFHCGKFCDPCRRINSSNSRIKDIKNGISNVISIRSDFVFNDLIIKCDSLLERACLTYFISNFNVVNIERCEFTIPYTYGGSNRQYLPDFIIETDNCKYLIECKSTVSKSLSERWHDYTEKSLIKRELLEKYAIENNMIPIWFCPTENKEYRRTYVRLQEERRKSLIITPLSDSGESA